MAMVRAKQQVRGSYRFFAASMNEEMERRFALEADLRRALARDELVVYYQPRVDARSGRITGAEALLRWRHPERGIVAPGEFIPLAEETGLIVPIGEWVLKAACARARQWKEEGFDLRVSVNLSARQFAEKTLVEDVARALRSSGLAPEALELEITETVVMQNPAQAAQTLEELKGLRVGLSLDDFGIGYSSLSYLQMFPFDGWSTGVRRRDSRGPRGRGDRRGGDPPRPRAQHARHRRRGGNRGAGAVARQVRLRGAAGRSAGEGHAGRGARSVVSQTRQEDSCDPELSAAARGR